MEATKENGSIEPCTFLLGWGDTVGDRGKQLQASNYFFFKWLLSNLQWIYL